MVTTRLNANSPPKEVRGMALLTFVNGIADAGQVAGRVSDSASDLGSSIQKEGGIIFVDMYQDSTARRESFAQMTPEQLDIIANPHKYSEKEKQEVANQYSQTYADIRGIESADSNFFKEGDLNEETAVGANGVDKRDTVAFTDGNAKPLYLCRKLDFYCCLKFKNIFINNC